MSICIDSKDDLPILWEGYKVHPIFSKNAAAFEIIVKYCLSLVIEFIYSIVKPLSGCVGSRTIIHILKNVFKNPYYMWTFVFQIRELIFRIFY